MTSPNNYVSIEVPVGPTTTRYLHLIDYKHKHYMGIFQMLLTLQDRNFSPLAAPVGSGFYKGPLNLNGFSAHEFFLSNATKFVALRLSVAELWSIKKLLLTLRDKNAI